MLEYAANKAKKELLAKQKYQLKFVLQDKVKMIK